MTDVHDSVATLAEYHARQRVNIAANKAASAKSALADARRRVRSIRRHLQKALELLGEDGDSGVREEIEAAVAELQKMGV